jgi:hypothetical protein
MAGAPLYMLNPFNRLDPGTNRPSYSAPVQPIRNGEAGNVSLKLLGLTAIPNSTIGAAQDLALTIPPPDDFLPTLADTNIRLNFTTVSNVLYDVQSGDDLISGTWSNIATNLLGSGGTTHINVGSAIESQRFYRLRLHF